MIRWANDTRHIAAEVRQYCRIMDHWRTVLPVPIHEVEYEETVVHLEGSLVVSLRHAAWGGNLPAWSFTEPNGRSGLPA